MNIARLPPLIFSREVFRLRPLAAIGMTLVIALRYLLALFFTGAAINKWRQGYLWSDYLRHVLTNRLEEIDPESHGAWFIEHIGIPYYVPLAWLVTWGETACALGLLLGLMTRGAALGAMLLMFAFAIGGFYDASLIVLALTFLPFLLLPTGRWLGLDARRERRFPYL